MRIRPTTRDDLPEVAVVSFDSFEHDKLYAWLFPYQKEYPGDYHKFIINRLRWRLVAFAQHSFVVVTEEGDPGWNGKPEVVGYSQFLRHGNDEGAKKWTAEPWFNSTLVASVDSCSFVLTRPEIERKLVEWESWYHTSFINCAIDHGHGEAASKATAMNYVEVFGPCWHLSSLSVSPKHQRRGIGNMLVEYGQKIAGDEGLPMTLGGSDVGKGLYLKRGFKIVGEREYSKGVSDVLMVWEPEGLEGRWLENIDGDTAKIRSRRRAS
jgi:ribosomal protein S18 acetylase RimI-like enzyme